MILCGRKDLVVGLHLKENYTLCTNYQNGIPPRKAATLATLEGKSKQVASDISNLSFLAAKVDATLLGPTLEAAYARNFIGPRKSFHKSR